MVEMPKDFSLDDAEPATDVHTFTGNRGLAIEEPLIFEIGSTETSGVDFEEPQESETRLGGLERTSQSACQAFRSRRPSAIMCASRRRTTPSIPAFSRSARAR